MKTWPISVGKIIVSILLFRCISAGFCAAQTTNIYDIRTFGAAGDGATLDTKSLQAAIDKSVVMTLVPYGSTPLRLTTLPIINAPKSLK